MWSVPVGIPYSTIYPRSTSYSHFMNSNELVFKMSLSILINTKILCLAVLGLTMKYAQSLSNRVTFKFLFTFILKRKNGDHIRIRLTDT